MSTTAVIQIIAGLTSIATETMLAIQKYNALMAKAAAEGREVTQDELDALRAENQALTDSVVDKLE